MNPHKSYINKKGEYFCDYPNEKIGGGNPYSRCSFCKISDPEINGQLKNHSDYCLWAMAKFDELQKIEAGPKDKLVAAYNNGLDTAISLVEEILDHDDLVETLLCALKESKRK